MKRLIFTALSICLALALGACAGPNSQEALQQKRPPSNIFGF